MKILVITIYFCILFNLSFSQSDGNPHKWDRKRRCDNDDYDPPCGLCEGYGGIPWSDKNEDIKLTVCTPIAEPKDVDNSTIADPYLPDIFTNEGFYEILIGMKTNPLCIGSFPGPDSLGDHCYATQEGVFYYDWTNFQLRIDYNV